MRQADLFRDEAISLDAVLTRLRNCVGEANGRTATELVAAITGRRSAGGERRLRKVIEALRTAGHPVCGHPANGYYLAATADELDRTCLFLVSRSMTSLKQVSAMRHVTLPDLHGQLGLSLGVKHERNE